MNEELKPSREASLVGDVGPPDDAQWVLRLYVAGQTRRSLTAFANLRRICELHLKGRYTIELIDLLKNPALAQTDQILAIPTLVRSSPEPTRKIIGDLSQTERVLIGLNITDPSIERRGLNDGNT